MNWKSSQEFEASTDGGNRTSERPAALNLKRRCEPVKSLQHQSGHEFREFTQTVFASWEFVRFVSRSEVRDRQNSWGLLPLHGQTLRQPRLAQTSSQIAEPHDARRSRVHALRLWHSQRSHVPVEKQRIPNIAMHRFGREVLAIASGGRGHGVELVNVHDAPVLGRPRDRRGL